MAKNLNNNAVLLTPTSTNNFFTDLLQEIVGLTDKLANIRKTTLLINKLKAQVNGLTVSLNNAVEQEKIGALTKSITQTK